MKLIAAALTLLMTTATFGHADTDDRLLAALQSLQTRVHLRTEPDRAASAAIETPVAILALTTALALSTRIPGIPWRVINAPARVVIKKAGDASAYAVGVGGALYLGAKMFKYVRHLRERNVPVDYATPAGLRRFFETPVDEQFTTARRDPAFTAFLIRLGESFAVLESGFKIPEPITIN